MIEQTEKHTLEWILAEIKGFFAKKPNAELQTNRLQFRHYLRIACIVLDLTGWKT